MRQQVKHGGVAEDFACKVRGQLVVSAHGDEYVEGTRWLLAPLGGKQIQIFGGDERNVRIGK